MFLPFSAISRGFSPFVFSFFGEISPFLPFFPGVIPRAKGYFGSDSSFISVEGLGFRPSNPFPRSRYPFLDNYFWALNFYRNGRSVTFKDTLVHLS